MPIRLRLTLLFAAAQLGRSLLDAADESLEARAAPIARAVTASPGRPGSAELSSQVIAPREAFAQVLDPAGQVVASTQSVAGERLLAAGELRAAQRAPRLVTRERDRRGESDLLYETLLRAEPVDRAYGTWVVVVGASLEPTEVALARVRTWLLAGGAGAVLLASVGAWLLAGALLRPVERLRRQVAELSEHDVAATVEVPGTRDELAALARTMNDLLGRLLAAVTRERRLVTDASHELRTPLAVLCAELELANRPQRTREELAEAVDHAAHEAQRLARLADDLLLLARSDEGTPIVWPTRQPALPSCGPPPLPPPSGPVPAGWSCS